MKKILVLVCTLLLALVMLASCGEEEEMPEVAKNIKGIEKFKVAIDYSNEEHWLALPEENSKEVDVIYYYPTAYAKNSKDEDEVSDIDSLGMMEQAAVAFEKQATVFEESCNVYAPFYRQLSGDAALSLSEEENEELLAYTSSKDPAAALDYYFENYNNGKPFILAGHSQGAETVSMLLADYMKEHPEYMERMVAAYVIGYSVTDKYFKENKHLKFTQGADDTGVIISYNTEGKGNLGKHNAVVKEGSIAINPINWKTDETYADVSENLGSIDAENNIVDGIADAQVDLERGVVICTTVDPSVYALQGAEELFGPESYHGYDFEFYYMNLRKNVADRIAAYLK